MTMPALSWLQLAVLWSVAIVYAVLPAFISGVPLEGQLSSDAEWYAAAMLRSADPPQLATDPSLPIDIRAVGEQLMTTALARAAQAFGIDMLRWSVLVSIFALLAFVTGVYVAVWVVAGTTNAFLVAGASIVEVHALGGTTFGFQPLGYLPRDLMLALAMFVIAFYAWSRDRGRPAMAGTFLACGLAANLYPVLFAHLVACLLGAELLLRRRVDMTMVLCAAASIVGAMPAIYDVVARATFTAPVDADLLRLRYGYQMVDSLPIAVTQYLRRTIVYAALLTALWLALRARRPEVLSALRPWFALAFSALVLSLVGVYLESTQPSFLKYLLSRTSVFFLFASMIVCCVGLRELAAGWKPRAPAVGVIAVVLVFGFQAGALSVARSLVDMHNHSDERLQLLAAAAVVRELTTFGDVVIAPSDEVPDIGASLRTYARRPVWQTYKDLGVVQVDGVRGRQAYERWLAMQEVLKSRSVESLLAFMRDRGIRAALLPESLLTSEMLSRPELRARPRGYGVLVAP